MRPSLILPLLLIAFAPACGPAPAPARTPAPAPAPTPAPAPLLHPEGTLSLAPNTPPESGRLVFAWRTPAEDAEARAGHFSMAAARALLARLTAGDLVDFAATPRIHYRIDAAPADAIPVVYLDIDHTFLATMFGRGHDYRGAAEPGSTDVVLSKNPPPKDTSETCAGDRMKLVVVHAPEVAGKVGNDIERRFCAWLPPSYTTSPQKRYPVVFLFGGLASTDNRFHGSWHQGTLADGIASDTKREVIVIAADLSTKTGSSYLEDSPVTGSWDTFFAKRAIPAIDAALRTMPKRTARALIGHSTGGHDALSYGLRHSELFGAIGASSPDAPDMETWLFRKDSRTAEPWLLSLTRLEDALGGAGQMASYAADWSPDWSPAMASRHGYSWPYDLQTGAPIDAVVAKWVAKSPLALLKDPAAVARIKKDLASKILITVGDEDEFGLFAPAKAFSEKLGQAGVEHTFHPTHGGHGTNEKAQLDDALHFVIAALDAAK